MALGQLLKIPTVSDYIFDADFDAVTDGIVKKYQLPLERGSELQELIYAVLDEVVTVPEAPALIAQAFGVDESMAKGIAADLYGNTLLPLAIYMPQLESEIVALGGKLSDYPSLRLQKDETANKTALKDITDSLQLSFSDVLLKRLSFLLQQYAKGEKTEESLKTFFTRSLNIGGLGLNEEQATALLAAALPQAASLIDEVKPSAPAPEKVVAPQPLEVPKAEVKQELEIAPTHEVAAEVPVAAMKPVRVIPPLPPPLKMAAPAVQAAPMKVVATKVMRAPAEADIDPNELKAPAKKAAAARKVAASAQDSFATALVLATENAADVLKKNKISEKVFADLATKAIRGVRDIYQTRDIVERDWELKGQDLATLMQAIALGVEAYHNAPRPAASEAAPKAAQPGDEHELNQRFSKLTTGESDQKIEPVKAQLTVGSAVMKTSDGQRKMVDVVSTARLAGPIEQLGKMTPAEFRRLSSSATEAAQKIEDLLSTLETTSYEERVKGVLAWRDSPMNQLYLQIAEEALSQGLALPEISSRRRAAGKDSLSPGEIKALALLNSKIRF